MTILLNILILAVGFVALIKGADLFVDGSSALARLFKVPGVIIGLTIVALGTSAPELAVSTSAALKGANEIAVSNVVGSNTFNLLMVLGICALINPLPIDKSILKRDFPFSIFLTILTFCFIGYPVFKRGSIEGLSMSDNVSMITRTFSIILLVIFVSYIIILVRSARKNKDAEEGDIKKLSFGKCFLLIIIGLALVILGGQFVVNSAKTLAATFGMSETLIGLTVVALGTSLPELVTSIVASKKNENGLAVGNVVGSNIFNILFIMGVSGTIHPIAVNFASVTDYLILIFVNLLTLLLSLKKSLGKVSGALMVICYICFMVFAALR
ncbi:MAG: calcium/sodium antiporter [Saccharofermentans sp.]|nr:calcium/sodium antiporter [Saccharofermentans sp.]